IAPSQIERILPPPSSRLPLKLHLRAELPYAIRGNAEKLCRRPRVALHENEEMLSPARDRLGSRRNEILPAKVVSRLRGLGDDSPLGGQRENFRDVRGLHE